MAGFNREELSRRSKAELLDYIEQQSDQLGRFETRFRGRAPTIGTLATYLVSYTIDTMCMYKGAAEELLPTSWIRPAT